MIEMIEKQRKQMYSQMDNLIAKKQKRKQEWFTMNAQFLFLSFDEGTLSHINNKQTLIC